MKATLFCAAVLSAIAVAMAASAVWAVVFLSDNFESAGDATMAGASWTTPAAATAVQTDKRGTPDAGKKRPDRGATYTPMFSAGGSCTTWLHVDASATSNSNGREVFDVEVSTDGGVTWRKALPGVVPGGFQSSGPNSGVTATSGPPMAAEIDDLVRQLNINEARSAANAKDVKGNTRYKNPDAPVFSTTGGGGTLCPQGPFIAVGNAGRAVAIIDASTDGGKTWKPIWMKTADGGAMSDGENLPSSLLKKETGTSRQRSSVGSGEEKLGASPLFQQATGSRTGSPTATVPPASVNGDGYVGHLELNLSRYAAEAAKPRDGVPRCEPCEASEDECVSTTSVCPRRPVARWRLFRRIFGRCR